MKNGTAYVLAFAVGLGCVLLGSKFFGMIGLVIGGIIGFPIANKIVENMTGKKPKEFTIFTKKKE